MKKIALLVILSLCLQYVTFSQNAFITTWQTTTANESITIPTTGGGYDYTIDWGDSTIETNQTGSATHTYSTAGIHTVSILGNFPRINFGGSPDREKLLTIEQWGDNKWTTMESAFLGCINLNITNKTIDSPDLSLVKSMTHMFFGAKKFDGNINNWNVENVTDMSAMFSGATTFSQNINDWNVMNVQIMGNMFQAAAAFNGDITNWKVDNVTNMRSMFEGATAFNKDLNDWNVENVTDMSSMFLGAEKFDRDLNKWNVINVTNMSNMFNDALEFNGDISSWNVTNVTDMSRMFDNASKFNGNINDWDVTNVTDMGHMFLGAEKFDRDLNKWNVSNVTDMSDMFNGALDFNGDISNWNVSEVTNMQSMFSNAQKFNRDISNWKFPLAKNLAGMFRGAIAFNGDLGNWDVANVEIMQQMFDKATNFEGKNLKNWNVENVTDMSFMFREAEKFNEDISNWIVGEVTNMNFMFRDAIAFNGDLGNWDVTKVEDMNNMFSGATAFEGKNIGKWQLSAIKIMSSMFLNVTNFNENISNWNVSKVTSMHSMFWGATSFDQDLGKWQVNELTTTNFMFFNAGLSTKNYDQLLKGWSTQTLKENVSFDVRNTQYCTAATERQFIIDTYNWNIIDDGREASPIITTITNVNVENTYTLPVITGTDLSGNEKYYTETLGGGTEYNAGDILTYDASTTYPITLYAYDSGSGCGESEENFMLTLTTATEFKPFITTWQTTAANESITIPTRVTESYDYTIDWGDGTIETNQTGSATHVYTTAGIQTISISGDFPRIYFFSNFTDNLEDKDKILTIEQWGDIKWTSMDGAFYRCINLNITNPSIDTPDLSLVTTTRSMFFSATKFDGDITNWKVDNVTNMNFMFEGTTAFNQDLGNWDVTKVETMESMFERATNFEGKNLKNWDVSNVTSMRFMFAYASKFNQDIGIWIVDNVTNMHGMFTSTDEFNHDIGEWDVTKVEDMSDMFKVATNFEGKNLKNWNVDNVTDMSSMFEEATEFNEDIGNWNVGNVTNMDSMFNQAPKFNHDIGEWKVDNVTNMSSMFLGARAFEGKNIGKWQVAALTNANIMFAFSGLSTKNYDQLLKGWSTQTLQPNVSFSVQNIKYCTAEAERQFIIDTYKWSITDGGKEASSEVDPIANVNEENTYTLPPIDGAGLSGDQKYYTETLGGGTEYNAGDILTYDASVSYPIILYAYDSGSCGVSEESFSLTLTTSASSFRPFITTWQTTTANESITIPAFGSGYNYTIDWGDGTIETNQTGSATHVYTTAGIQTISISGDFPRINFSNGGDKDKILTIEQWGDIKWISMESAFSGCINLNITNPSIDAPDLSLVTNMTRMFFNAAEFDGDISNWKVNTITDMSFMLAGAEKFNQDISGWNVSNVKNMLWMLRATRAFDQNLASWNMANVTSADEMFFASGLSTLNYDLLLKGWSTQALQPNVIFSAIGVNYCTAETERQSIIDNFGWSIRDSGKEASPIIAPITNVNEENTYTLPVITGTDLSGNEKYYTETLGGGTPYNVGDELTYDASVTYPITLYAYDSGSCGVSEESFMLTLTEAAVFKPFITTWQTTTANESITIPTVGLFGYDYTIDWGDGTIETNQTGSATHVYTTAGIQTISISGDFPRISFLASPGREKLLTIEQWGDIKWTSMQRAFFGCTNLNITNPSIDTPDLSLVKDMSFMFQIAAAFNGDISNWNVDNVTDMRNMFNGATAFNKDLNDWKVDNVTDMSFMFQNAKKFNKNLNNWKTSEVTEMQYMFDRAENFDGDISTWDTKKVTTVNNMFSNTIAFNQDISKWELPAVTSITSMFSNAQKFNKDISNWKFPLAKNLTGMFSGATAFNGDLGNWDVAHVENMGNMFQDATNFEGKNLKNWNVGNVTDMSFMFFNATEFNEDIGNWIVGEVTNMNSMFREAIKFNRDIGEWNVSEVTNMQSMFSEATSFDQNLAKWHVAALTNADLMFFSSGLSTKNYDQLLKGWSTQILQENVNFDVRGTQYCTAETERQFIIDTYKWNIRDDGKASSEITPITNVNVENTYTLPVITGTDLSGNEKYYTETLGGGTEYNAGDILTYDASVSYPIILYAYDSGSCGVSEESFSLTLTTSASSFRPFITTWQTTTANESITIPAFGSGYNYTIDWGDGTIETNQTIDAIHSYKAPGIHTVKISGDFPSINFSKPTASKEKIRSIEQWGDIKWTTMERAFSDCINLNITNTTIDAPDLSLVTNMSSMFERATAFNGNINDWNVENVTDMSLMFQNATAFNQDINDWNVINVTNMSRMFSGAEKFKGNIDDWNVENVTDMSSMFSGAIVFNQDISRWKVSNVKNMSNMFSGAIEFEGNIGDWEVTNVTNMSSMFSGAEKFNSDLDNWEVTNVTNMSSMFSGAEKFNSDLNKWNVTKVTNMSFMFSGALEFDGNIEAWKVSNVTNMSFMFERAEKFKGNIDDWIVSNVEDMSFMFSGAITFNQDISGWNVSNVKNMLWMFRGTTAFNQNLASWNMANVTSADEMFFASGLSTLNYDLLLKGWSTQALQPNVTFSAIGVNYCTAETERQSIIDNFGWSIRDSGKETSPVIAAITNVNEKDTYTLPAITGTDLSGNEKYYTETLGGGTEYNAGDVLTYDASVSYPIILYAYDSGICGVSEESFMLTLTPNTKTTLIIAANPVTKTYGNADPTLTYAITSGTLAIGDLLAGSLTRVPGEDIGSYAINSTLSHPNYTINFISDDLSIIQKPITVTANTITKTFEEADPILTYTLNTPLITGDVLNGALTRELGENIGNYAINQGTLNNLNYEITYNASIFTILSKELTLPNAFTPDNDGVNDVFEIQGLEKRYPNFALKVHNRNGSVLFTYKHNGSTTVTPRWWDGTYKGKLMPTGTYFFSLEYNDEKTSPKASWLYLNR